MYKEIFICIFIVICIVSGNIVTKQYAQKSITECVENLSQFREEMDSSDKNYEQEKNRIKDIKKQWDNKKNKLAYFVEHDELEKVENQLIGLESFIDTHEYSEAICELDKCIFAIRHIEEKFFVNLKNIF